MILQAELCVPTAGREAPLNSPTVWEGRGLGPGTQGTLTTHWSTLSLLLCCYKRSSSWPAQPEGGWDTLNVQQFMGEILALLLDYLVVLFQVLVEVGQEVGVESQAGDQFRPILEHPARED